MNDSIEVVSPARALIDGNTITETDIEGAIDEMLVALNETNNPEYMDNAIETMIGMNKFSMFGLAKILYGYSNWWERTNQDEVRGDTFEDYINAQHGLNPIVMSRYISIWHKYETKQFPDEIKNRPLKDQQEIASVIDQGYEITEDDWRQLIEAQNDTAVRQITRRLKGKKARKSAYVPYLERSGDITIWHLDSKYHVGFLKNPKDTDDPIEKKVREKIWNRAISSLGLIVK